MGRYFRCWLRHIEKIIIKNEKKCKNTIYKNTFNGNDNQGVCSHAQWKQLERHKIKITFKTDEEAPLLSYNCLNLIFLISFQFKVKKSFCKENLNILCNLQVAALQFKICRIRSVKMSICYDNHN